MTKDEMVGWHHRLNGHEFEQALQGGEGFFQAEDGIRDSSVTGLAPENSKSELRPFTRGKGPHDGSGSKIVGL